MQVVFFHRKEKTHLLSDMHIENWQL